MSPAGELLFVMAAKLQVPALAHLVFSDDGRLTFCAKYKCTMQRETSYSIAFISMTFALATVTSTKRASCA